MDKLKKRLDNEYAQSIQIFYNELNLDQIILVGYDDRINQLSNYAVFKVKISIADVEIQFMMDI